jgi:hypothetical protein
MTPGPSETDRRFVPRRRGVFDVDTTAKKEPRLIGHEGGAVYEYNIISCAAREKAVELLREAERERIARQARASRRRLRLSRLAGAIRSLRRQRQGGLAREV